MEYLLLGILIGIIATILLEVILQKNKRLRKEFWDNHKSFFGYHVHHSCYGLLFIIIGFFSLWHPFMNSFLLFGIGLGIIATHTYTAKHFVFINRIAHEENNKKD